MAPGGGGNGVSIWCIEVRIKMVVKNFYSTIMTPLWRLWVRDGNCSIDRISFHGSYCCEICTSNRIGSSVAMNFPFFNATRVVFILNFNVMCGVLINTLSRYFSN